MRVSYSLRSLALTAVFSIVLAAATLSLTSCQRRNSLVIEMGNPLSFVVSGPGTLTNLQVTGPDLEREPSRQDEGCVPESKNVRFKYVTQIPTISCTPGISGSSLGLFI